MSDSDSSLSSPPTTDDEMPVEMEPVPSAKAAPQKKKKKNANILTFFKQRSPSPPPRKRPASPPHELVPEDNPQIAFIVMFRSRFNEAFPRGAPSVGPQDIEQGVVDGAPSSEVEGLLCALLGLVLNRKKPVEKGHYGRALEEAIQTQKSQWPRQWTANPISGGRSFNTMTAVERIILLHTLTLWSLNQNEQVKAMINNAYKSRTTKDRLDTNIPLSVQPWGRDGDRRRYWLVEGQNDTHFRVYRESDPKLKNVQWISVTGSIEELQMLSKKLDEEDGHKEAKALGERMMNAVPRFEASEQKRKRREYRVQRNAAFTRPEPGFSLYEGRTRGKRLRYTFSEEEDFDSDNVPSRRSGRQSGRETPAAPAGPTVTASGRQVRSRATGAYGETLHSGQVTDRASPATGDYRSDVSEDVQESNAHSRSARAANRSVTNGRAFHRPMDSDDEEDATSWDGGDEDEEEPDQMEVDEYEDDGDESSEEEEEPQSLIVTLRYGKESFKASNTPTSSFQSQNGEAAKNDSLQPTPSAQATFAVNVPPTEEAMQQPPELALAAPPSALLPPPAVSFVSNGVPVLSQQPVVPRVSQPTSVAYPDPLPRPDTMPPTPAPPHAVPATTQKIQLPPVSALDILPQQQQQATQAQLPPVQVPPTQMPPTQLPQTQLPPFSSNNLPPPTATSTWQ